MANKTSIIRSRANDKPLAIDGVPVKNEILATSPAEEQASIVAELVFVELRTHDVLHVKRESPSNLPISSMTDWPQC